MDRLKAMDFVSDEDGRSNLDKPHTLLGVINCENPIDFPRLRGAGEVASLFPDAAKNCERPPGRISAAGSREKAALPDFEFSPAGSSSSKNVLRPCPLSELRNCNGLND